MKKTLKIVGIVFLLFITLLIILISYSYFKSEQYNNAAIPYIKAKIPELSSWNSEVMEKYLTPKTEENNTSEYLKQSTLQLSTLGQLKNVEEPQFVNIDSEATPLNGKQTIATYNVLSRYENADVTIRIRLLEVDGAFEVYSFYIDSISPTE
ncbi:MAG: hypothetical protein ACI80S_000836 [Pseudohongiellaceae bacterium]|jgi:hypothetical protein